MLQKLCVKCRNGIGVYSRHYSGETLCKRCFISSIEEKTHKTINKFSMLRHDDRVAVAVSGGKDSLSLLYVLTQILERNHRAPPIAITVDEGIRNYRDESLAIVERFCANLNIENRVVSYRELFGRDMDQAMLERPSIKMSSCSICGTFRRRAIDLAAESVDANVIATAHNLDDQLQTFIINMMAGDVQRIGWTYPQTATSKFHNLKKIKPFCEIYEQEIVFYALQRDIPFQTEDCPYMDESIRTHIREFINTLETQRPGIKYNLYNSMLKISNNLRTFSTDIVSQRCKACGRTSTSGICSVCRTISILEEGVLSDDTG
jgi:cytoplasmic tRNA 2-thiolation protein 1